LRRLVAEFLSQAAPPPGGRVVDYGCADAPYADLLPDGVVHVGADLVGNVAADIALRSDGAVPLPDGFADVVLSTQVLEHVVDPAVYLAECARLLRPGGSLVLTTHGIMYEHRDPEDYWRWTSDGLSRVVTAAGLEVIEVRGVVGLVAAALQLIQHGTAGRVPSVLRKLYILVFQVLIAAADGLSSEQSRRHNALVIGVRAVRPLSQA
jgi:SAM-dependent methyltransferase